MEEAVGPEAFCLITADQAEKGQDPNHIQASEHHETAGAVPVAFRHQKVKEL